MLTMVLGEASKMCQPGLDSAAKEGYIPQGTLILEPCYQEDLGIHDDDPLDPTIDDERKQNEHRTTSIEEDEAVILQALYTMRSISSPYLPKLEASSSSCHRASRLPQLDDCATRTQDESNIDFDLPIYGCYCSSSSENGEEGNESWLDQINDNDSILYTRRRLQACEAKGQTFLPDKTSGFE